MFIFPECAPAEYRLDYTPYWRVEQVVVFEGNGQYPNRAPLCKTSKGKHTLASRRTRAEDYYKLSQ